MELGLRQSLDYLSPEIALGVAALTVWLLDRLERLDRTGLGEIAILGAALSVFLAARLSGWGEVWILERLFVVDGFAVFFKIFIGLAAVAVLWIWLESSTVAREGEVCALVLSAAVALDLMASAANLASAYFCVELASLALWRLTHRSRPGGSRPHASGVAAGAVSLLMLGAAAWLAGFAGSADYERIHQAVFDLAPESPFGVACVVMSIVIALPARVSIATSTRGAHVHPSLAAFVAVAFAAGGLALSLRLLFAALSSPAPAGWWAGPSGLDWSLPLAAAAIAAMTLGNLAGLRERSLLRVLAATSIAHLGYALLGAAAASQAGLEAALFYVAVSALASLGAFHAAALIVRTTGREEIESCRGLLRGAGSPAALALAVFLLSLSGAPLLAGFVGRRYLFGALLARGFKGVAAIAVVNSLLSFWVYARILRALYAPGPAATAPRLRLHDASFAGLFAAATVVFGIHPRPLLELAARSVQWLPR